MRESRTSASPQFGLSRSRGIRLCALLSASALPGQLDWRFDLAGALVDAGAKERAVLVCLHDAGQTKSEAMTPVYGSARLARLQDYVVPVLVLPAGEAQEAGARKLIGDRTLDQVREHALRATLELFGPGASVTVPQQLLLDPKGGVLWHHLGQVSAEDIERAALQTRSTLKDGDRARTRRVLAQAENLARSAKRDANAVEKLRVVVRTAPLGAFGEVMELAARQGIATRELIVAAVGALPEFTRRERVLALESRRGCRSLCGVAAGILSEPGQAPALCRRVREVFGPLPALRPAGDLAGVDFADATPRRLEQARGHVLVLWFFLPDDPRLDEQVKSVAPAIAELMAGGVEVLALAACTDLKAARKLAASTVLPCPIGTYAWDARAPLQGVDSFPAAVVLDQDGRLVYDDHGPGVKEYAGFAPTARGLNDYLRTRPILAQR